MGSRPSVEPRSGPERAAAWLVTGPLGHLGAFLADIGVAWARWASRSLRARVAGALRRR